MNSDLWRQTQEAFERLKDTPTAERDQLLNQICDGNDILRQEVESLLKHHAKAGEDFLSSPAKVFRLSSHDHWAETLVGQKVGRYTLVRLIASGGMGYVYEAIQEKPARSVALKIMRPGFSAPSALARFQLEPEVLGKLQHANIAQVFEAGIHEENQQILPYFVMELIHDAQPIVAYTESHKLTIQQRLELFIKVCNAIQCGHQKGIVHRDLKPSNILVGHDGEPKVIDFGVARSTDADVIMTSSITNAGDLIGTFYYMSPEQCDGDSKAIDTRSDVYSLGVVLYELLTNASPYNTTNSTVYAVMRKIKEEPPRCASELNRKLRGDLDAILFMALEKQPNKRYASAGELAQDIQRQLNGDAISARQPNVYDHLFRWSRKHPIASTTIASILIFGFVALAVLGSMEWYTWKMFEQPEELVRKGLNEVVLLSHRKTVIHRWDGGQYGSVCIAEFLLPNKTGLDHPLVLISYGQKSSPELKNKLQAFNPEEDLDTPIWEFKLESNDQLPPILAESGFECEQFSPGNIWFFDVVPDESKPKQKEIICQYRHNINAVSGTLIFSMQGELLYQLWRNGGANDCYWVADSGVLVFAGMDGNKEWRNCGCPDASFQDKLRVVFGIMPTLGNTKPYWLHNPDEAKAAGVAWYKKLKPCPVPNVYMWWKLIPPQHRPANEGVELCLCFRSDPESAVSWCIDGNGQPLPGTSTVLTDPYIVVRRKDPRFPKANEFGLVDMEYAD